MTHHALGPSKAHRYLVCTGSIHFDREMPESIWAEDGKLGHDILERILKGQIVLTGDDINGTPAPAYRIQQAIEVRDFIHQWRQVHPDFVMEMETPLSITQALGLGLGFNNPDRAHLFDGTADVVAYNDIEALVLDAKFGFVRVEPENNPQLMLYAMGLLDELRRIFGKTPKLITLVIAQPNYEGIMDFREHRMTLIELRQWYSTNHEAIERAWDAAGGDLEAVVFNASSEKACRYCPGRSVCDARTKKAYDMASEEWRMTKTLADLLPMLPAIRHICDDLEKTAVKMLAEGQPVPGFKLVESRSIRKWAVPDVDVIQAANEILGLERDAGFAPRKLLSPAQMEKKFGTKGKALTEAMAMVPRGGPKLVPDSDPREPYKPDNFSQEEIDSITGEE